MKDISFSNNISSGQPAAVGLELCGGCREPHISAEVIPVRLAVGLAGTLAIDWPDWGLGVKCAGKSGRKGRDWAGGRPAPKAERQRVTRDISIIKRLSGAEKRSRSITHGVVILLVVHYKEPGGLLYF